MRFDVVTLAFALAAPAMSASVGWAQGQNGPIQEFEAPASTPSAVAVQQKAQTGTLATEDANGAVIIPANNQAANNKPSNTNPNQPANSPSASKSVAPVTTPSTAPAGTKQSPAASPSAASSAAASKQSPSTGGTTGANGGTAPPGGQVLYIVNNYGATLNIVKDKSGGSDPSNVPPTLTSGATATIGVPKGWSGRFALNPAGVPAGDERGTKIEGAITSDNFWDISLVDGYTVPVTCTCGTTTQPFIGCNIDLYKQSAKCPSPAGNALCLNPARPLDNGPSNSWFAACQDSAYTFPKNDIATQTCHGDKITCCIGTSCAASARQKGKRDLTRHAKRHGHGLAHIH